MRYAKAALVRTMLRSHRQLRGFYGSHWYVE